MILSIDRGTCDEGMCPLCRVDVGERECMHPRSQTHWCAWHRCPLREGELVLHAVEYCATAHAVEHVPPSTREPIDQVELTE